MKCEPSLLMEYAYIFGEHEKFIVALDVQRHMSILDSLKSLVGWNTLSLWRHVEGVGCRVFTPQVLLHSSAGPKDIFNALVVVHKVIHELKKETSSCENRKSNIENPDDQTTVKFAIDLVQRSYSFQKLETKKIVDRLVSAGWNMERFTFAINSLPRIGFGTEVQ